MSLLTPHELLDHIRTGATLLSDGAMGSELMRRGVAPDRILAANLERPELVRAVHRDYLQAGAQILTANTFAAYKGIPLRDAIEAGIRIAREEAANAPLDIGVWAAFSTQMLQTYSGLYNRFPDEMRGALVVETCLTLDMAVAGALSARRVRPHLLALTYSFHSNQSLEDGKGPEDAMRDLAALGVDVLGANCGEHPMDFIPLAKRMYKMIYTPLIMQPSAGLPKTGANGKLIYPFGPKPWAEIAFALFAEGINVVGGCCGTTPAHIAALAERMRTADRTGR